MPLLIQIAGRFISHDQHFYFRTRWAYKEELMITQPYSVE